MPSSLPKIEGGGGLETPSLFYFIVIQMFNIVHFWKAKPTILQVQSKPTILQVQSKPTILQV